MIGNNYVSCSPFRVPIARLAAAQVAIKYKANGKKAAKPAKKATRPARKATAKKAAAKRPVAKKSARAKKK